MLLALVAAAHAGPKPSLLTAEQVAAAAARCGEGYQAVPGQSFRLAEPGRPWDGHGVVLATGTQDLCVVHLRPSTEPTVTRVPVVSCMNCGVEAVDAVGFADVSRDGVPDVSVVTSGITGWDPQSTTSPMVPGTTFVVLVASADWASLTPLPEAAGIRGATLKELWSGLAAAPPAR